MTSAEVIVFAPHPDDEVIACGGTILNRTEKGIVVCICFSTDGSQSHKAVLGLDVPSSEELTVIRRKEAFAAAAALGVPAGQVTMVGARDTSLRDELDRLRTAVDALLKASPTVREIFLPHERRELNADHSMTGQVVLERLAAAGLTPSIYKYVVWDAEIEASFGYSNRDRDRAKPDADEVLVREDISRQLERKYVAFLEHRTQTTLFVPEQSRTIVPTALSERVRNAPFEEFWIKSTSLAGQEQ
jgi:LmbE family N-acetylglucosaminyl deacetylase